MDEFLGYAKEVGLGFFVTILTVILPIVSSYAVVALRRLAIKLDVEVSIQQEELLRQTVRGFVAGAEEWARREKKRGVVRSGLEKMDMVVAGVQRSYPMKNSSEIQRIADQELGAMRGISATDVDAAPILTEDMA